MAVLVGLPRPPAQRLSPSPTTPWEIEGELYFLDLAVPELKLAAEIDGWEHHKSFESFVA